MNINKSFSSKLSVLRKERGISQKFVSEKLGVSQSLLSHYEKGLRECGLDFIVRAADFYNVSCDYLLGRTPERTGAKISIEDSHQKEAENDDISSEFNKKIIDNSLYVIFDLAKRFGSSQLSSEISSYLIIAIYNAFRILYSANKKNPQEIFSIKKATALSVISAALSIASSNATTLSKGENTERYKQNGELNSVCISPETLSSEYPRFAAAILNLIDCAENRMKF